MADVVVIAIVFSHIIFTILLFTSCCFSFKDFRISFSEKTLIDVQKNQNLVVRYYSGYPEDIMYRIVSCADEAAEISWLPWKYFWFDEDDYDTAIVAQLGPDGAFYFFHVRPTSCSPPPVTTPGNDVPGLAAFRLFASQIPVSKDEAMSRKARRRAAK